MNTTYFIHLVADYGVGDPSFGEVIQKLKMLDRSLQVYPTSVPALSTIATGFWIAQYALYNTFEGLAVYSNTAPRKDIKHARDNNHGEILVYAKLKNEVPIIAVNAGFNLSFIKTEIVEFNEVNVLNKGSQFRSRDFYPEAVIKILNGKSGILAEDIDINSIPDIPKNRISWVDGFGNIKTTIRRSQVSYKQGEKIKIKIGNISKTAYFVDGIFSVAEGELSFAKGSTGGTDGFMEIFLRGDSAWELFGKAKVEAEIKFESSYPLV